ncbi:hypothetical protein BH09BAC5_BH09BAC5_23460 [soil metagenome]
MNSRILTAKNATSFGVLVLFWIPVAFLSLLLVYNTIPYFSFDAHMPFLEERTVLYSKLVWRISFYIHIAAGSFCIITALLQFSSWILKKRKKIHVYAGKIYVFVVLLIGAPSGFYMTFFAEGGVGERICFMLMAIFWFYSTLRGFKAAAYDKNFLSHKYWMMRSYAMALTAVTFRIYHIAFDRMGLAHFDNYSISLWISVFGNALVCEAIIFSQSRKYLSTLNS